MKIKLLNKLIAIFIGVIFFISVLSVNFGFGLTSTRLSLLLLFIIIPIQFSIQKTSTNLKIPRLIFYPFIITIFLFLSASISTTFYSGDSLWSVISWIFLGLLSSVLALAVSKINLENDILFHKIIVLLIFLFCFFTLYNLYSNGLLGLGSSVIRSYYGEHAVNDLNRTMNTFFIFFAINFGILYFNVSRNSAWKLMSIISISVSLFLFLTSGSRQNIIAAIVFIIVLILLDLKSKKVSLAKKLLHQSKKIIFFFGLIFIAITLLVKIEFIDSIWIEQRFLSFFIEKEISSSDESRLNAAINAIQYSFENNGMGIGAGNFPGMEVHNGYLLYLAESGIILGGISLFICFMLIALIWKKTPPKSRITAIYWSIFIVVAIVLTNLKVLFREPVFWSTLGIAIGFSNRRNLITNN